jgi:hypothetical protein
MTTETTAAVLATGTPPVCLSDQIALAETDHARVFMFVHAAQHTTHSTVLGRAEAALRVLERSRAIDRSALFQPVEELVCAKGILVYEQIIHE